MVKSRGALRNLRQNWASVRAAQDTIRRHLLASFAMPMFGGFVSKRVSDVSHAMVLLFACSVLEAALQQLRREHAFAAPNRQLGALLEKSRTTLPWVDFDAIADAVELRNQMAHQRLIPLRADTWRAIDAIERELRHFGILE